MKQSKTVFLYLIGCTVVCLLLCCVLLVGRAYAHYESRKDFPVATSAQPVTHLYLQPVSEKSSTDWERKEFTLSNYSEADTLEDQPAMMARITVLATVGMEDPDKAGIVLKKDGTSFVGRAEAIREGTELYHSFGPGWCYSFFDSDGTELTIPFAAREQTEISFALCVQTNQKINYDSMLRVQAVGQVLLEEE